MRTFRKFLAMTFAVLCMIGTIAVTGISSEAATVNISYSGIKAGTTVKWYPPTDINGYKLTDGGTQKLCINLSESGNKLAAGIYQVSKGKYISMYSGTLTGKTTGVLSKTLSTGSGYYKPYVTNNNASVSFTVNNTSYFTYK